MVNESLGLSQMALAMETKIGELVMCLVAVLVEGLDLSPGLEGGHVLSLRTA